VTSGFEAAIVIPARRASTRLPEKLLLADSGRPLLAHTLQQCLKVAGLCADLGEWKPPRVIAAVDCPELQQVAIDAGAEAVLTDPSLPSGSDRVWAVLEQQPQITHAVNVQGDEPEMDPAAILMLLQALHQGAEVATLCAPLETSAFEDPSAVKVVRNLTGDALYFSRAPIPHPRSDDGKVAPRLHLGIYGYSRAALRQFARTDPSPLEKCEGLEQLRFLEHGIPVRVMDWPHAFPGIDTPSDYDAFLTRLNRTTPPSNTRSIPPQQ
jgi:3-deoxy-manno-octulosonate cytidylyltransferase (CMP-KDO synthetase)